MCIGNRFQRRRPTTALPENIRARARSDRRAPAIRQTPSAKASRSTLQALKSGVTQPAVGAPMANSSLTACARMLYPG